MKKESFDYLNLMEQKGRKNQINILKKEVAGIQVLELVFEHTGEKNDVDQGIIFIKMLKKTKRKIKKYYQSNNMIGVDVKILDWLKMDNISFQARKQEFLNQKEKIMSILKNRNVVKEEKRFSILFVVNSIGWNQKEFLEILLTAKNYYEDIYVVSQTGASWMLHVETVLYEEWGVTIQRLSEEEAQEQKVDAAVFFQIYPDLSKIKKYQYNASYVIFEVETKRIKRNQKSAFEEREEFAENKIYSGFVYQREGVEIPYQMAVDIANQNPVFYREFHISDIAIYVME